jgi:acyl-CoA synthetase (AMP-forming)/AMP-acid ligase II
MNVASISDTVGCFHTLWTLVRGGRTVVLRSFDVAKYMRALTRHRPTHSVLFLPQAIHLLADREAVPDAFGSLRMLCLAGDKAPVDLIERCVAVTGVVPLLGYGLTESFVVALNISPEPAQYESMGRPVPGVEVEVVDPSGGRVAPGETGEILVRSAQNAVGYWRAPRATRAAFRDGWLHTGDLGRLDEAGHLWFRGRRKQIIIRGGENLTPQEIEEELYAHPAVRLAGAVGVAHPIEGEVPRAFVELKDGARATGEELLGFLRERMIHYKLPDRVVVTRGLPEGRTGKIDRRRLPGWI